MWREFPTRLPRRCAMSGTSEAGAGPYFCSGRYLGELDEEGRATGRVFEVQVSMRSVKSMLGEAGLEPEQVGLVMALREQVEQLAMERDDLLERIEEYKSQPTPDDIFDVMIEKMEKAGVVTTAPKRRPGRPPKGAA